MNNTITQDESGRLFWHNNLTAPTIGATEVEMSMSWRALLSVWPEQMFDWTLQRAKWAMWDYDESERKLASIELQSISAAVGEAEIVVWPIGMWAVATDGCEAFDKMPLGELAFTAQNQLWLFQGEIPCLSDEMLEMFELPHPCAPLGMSLTRLDENLDVGEPTLQFCMYFAHFAKEEEPQTRENTMPLLRPFPPLPATFPCPLNEFHAALAFLNSEVNRPETMRLPRGERRRMQKAGEEEPTVKRVILRRAAVEERGQGSGRQVSWSCKWTVRGHWRKQWHPKTSEHKPRYIQTYVKGPDDKPLKEASERLFLVKR